MSLEEAVLPPSRGTHPLDELRQGLPDLVAGITQIVVDNPGQFALIGAGTIVATRAAVNIVRPRTAIEALALFVTLQVGLPLLVTHAVHRGWLKIRVRDGDGCLVPLEPSSARAL